MLPGGLLLLKHFSSRFNALLGIVEMPNIEIVMRGNSHHVAGHCELHRFAFDDHLIYKGSDVVPYFDIVLKIFCVILSDFSRPRGDIDVRTLTLALIETTMMACHHHTSGQNSPDPEFRRYSVTQRQRILPRLRCTGLPDGNSRVSTWENIVDFE